MRPRNRRGFSLVELLVTLVVTAVVGTALTNLLVKQQQFFNRQEGMSNARAVSRGALNMMLSEMRMLEQTGGMWYAWSNMIGIRAPFAIGVVCATSSGSTTVALMPMDSVMYATSGITGYAWRDEDGNYTYQDWGVGRTAVTAAACAGESVTAPPGGRYVTLTPGAAAAPIGAPIFLTHHVIYWFGASPSVPGGRALFRYDYGGFTYEEVVAPFDNTARFRFFVNDGATAQDAVPASYDMITGLELVLTSSSEFGAPGDREKQYTTTAVFFKNRID